MRRAVAALIVGATVMAACAGAGSDAQPDTAIPVFGPWTGTDADAFAAALDGFDGPTVRYTGSGDFTGDLQQRVADGFDDPAVAMIPQPAFIDELARSGDLVALSDDVTSALEDSFPPDALVRSSDGSLYAIPYRSNVKSLVWYRPDVFEANGWSPPATLEELGTLVEQIDTESELAPWCFSVSAGGETGWPATDWIEDLVLRDAGTEVYDQWVAGDVEFESAPIRSAFEAFAELVLGRGRTFGGTQSILGVEVARASEPLFTDPAGCAMYKQASFATSWFPSGTTVGPDGRVDFFTLPGDAAATPPLLVAGTSAVQLVDGPEADELMAYLASPEGAEGWARRGGYLSLRSDVDPRDYYRDLDTRFGEVIQRADETRFDASDRFETPLRRAMLSGLTSWIGGRQSLDELLASLDSIRAGEG